jgi:hypothetical protein
MPLTLRSTSYLQKLRRLQEAKAGIISTCVCAPLPVARGRFFLAVRIPMILLQIGGSQCPSLQRRVARHTPRLPVFLRRTLRQLNIDLNDRRPPFFMHRIQPSDRSVYIGRKNSLVTERLDIDPARVPMAARKRSNVPVPSFHHPNGQAGRCGMVWPCTWALTFLPPSRVTVMVVKKFIIASQKYRKICNM